MSSNIDWNQMRKQRLKQFIPFTKEFDFVGILVVLFLFGVGFLSLHFGYERLGKTFISKRRRNIEWGEPFEWDIVNSIPLWFMGIVFIGFGILTVYNNLKIDKKQELELEAEKKKSEAEFQKMMDSLPNGEE